MITHTEPLPTEAQVVAFFISKLSELRAALPGRTLMSVCLDLSAHEAGKEYAKWRTYVHGGEWCDAETLKGAMDANIEILSPKVKAAANRIAAEKAMESARLRAAALISEAEKLEAQEGAQ